MDGQTSRGTRRAKALAILLLGLGGVVFLVGVPETVGALVPVRPTRRTALFALPALTSVFGLPLPARAVCTCPTGLDSCVCTADDPAKKATNLRVDPSGRKRADAAGREVIQGQLERAEMFGTLPATSAQSPKAQAISPTSSASSLVSSVQPGYLGLSGGGDLGDMSVDEAKARFAKIVLETKRKREEQFGFELDADDVKQIADSLRAKYCGQFGLIGPC